jgi:hypothetical protein
MKTAEVWSEMLKTGIKRGAEMANYEPIVPIGKTTFLYISFSKFAIPV